MSNIERIRTKNCTTLTDKIFIIALISIPFDNIFIAPSSGWATISPIVFFIYLVFLFINNSALVFKAIKRNIKLFSLIYFLALYGTLMALINNLNLSNLIDTFIGLALGTSIYISFYCRYVLQKKSFEGDIKFLYYAYIASMIYGILKYIALEKVSSMQVVFKFLEKRYYTRNGFSFTEPSFMSIHLYGVILLIITNIENKKIKRNWIIMLVIYIILGLSIGGSSRFIVDSLTMSFLLVIYILIKSIEHKRFYITFILLITISIFSAITTIDFSKMQSENSSVQRIIDIANKGLYADASLGSRIFRIEAQMEGYKKEPIKALFGAGIGNSYQFVQSGYSSVRHKWIDPYTWEVDGLEFSTETSFFCMYTRLISEFGFISFIIIMILLIAFHTKYRGSLLALLVIFNLYYQFDSYMFYSIWIYLALTIRRYKIYKLNILNRG